MFFAPPQVKSLSRYAEFGAYLQQKHFLIMLGLAIMLHAIVIGIYAMAPRQEVIKIPVRVLNIKLGDDGDNIVAMPSPSVAMPSAPVVMQEPEKTPSKPDEHHPAKNAQSVIDSAFNHLTHPKPAHPDNKARNLAAENTLSTPKQYVRAGEHSGTGTGHGRGGSGRSRAGTPEGDEIIQRYEQTISLWMAQHKTYPDAAKQAGIEGDAIVRIRINREGRILYNAIDRSSGNAMIDNAVLAMVRASNPVPVVPDEYPDGNQFEFLIPVSFRLQ